VWSFVLIVVCPVVRIRYVDACPMSVSERSLNRARDSRVEPEPAPPRPVTTHVRFIVMVIVDSSKRTPSHTRVSHRHRTPATRIPLRGGFTAASPRPPNGRNPPRGRAPGAAPVLHTAAATARAKSSAPITALVPRARERGEQGGGGGGGRAAMLAYRASNRESSAESVTCGSSSAYAAAFASWRRLSMPPSGASLRRLVVGSSMGAPPPAPPNSAPFASSLS